MIQIKTNNKAKHIRYNKIKPKNNILIISILSQIGIQAGGKIYE